MSYSEEYLHQITARTPDPIPDELHHLYEIDSSSSEFVPTFYTKAATEYIKGNLDSWQVVTGRTAALDSQITVDDIKFTRHAVVRELSALEATRSLARDTEQGNHLELERLVSHVLELRSAEDKAIQEKARIEVRKAHEREQALRVRAALLMLKAEQPQ